MRWIQFSLTFEDEKQAQRLSSLPRVTQLISLKVESLAGGRNKQIFEFEISLVSQPGLYRDPGVEVRERAKLPPGQCAARAFALTTAGGRVLEGRAVNGYGQGK